MGFAHPPPLSWSLLADCRQGRSPVSNEALAYSVESASSDQDKGGGWASPILPNLQSNHGLE